jgi:hypothetical protein
VSSQVLSCLKRPSLVSPRALSGEKSEVFNPHSSQRIPTTFCGCRKKKMDLRGEVKMRRGNIAERIFLFLQNNFGENKSSWRTSRYFAD